MSTDSLDIGYRSWPKITTVLDNNLISKMSYFFPLLLNLMSVLDVGFKLQAEICRKFNTLEVLSTDIYLKYTQPDVICEDFARHIERLLS
jgi:hypothetical protein